MIVYRAANPSEVEQLIQWAATEGWNPGLDDAALFCAVDSAGFQIALDGDRPVAG